MTDRPSDLVDPARDPLTEVALSVRFERLERLGSAHIGMFWSEVLRAEGFVTAEEHPPVEIAIEVDTPFPKSDRKPRVKLLDRPEVPRFWFVNHDGTELVQIQQDWIAFNWRRRELYDYSHYEHMRHELSKNLSQLVRFLDENKLGEIAPVQAEILYVNHVHFLDPSQAHRSIAEIIRPWSGYSTLGGAELEDVSIRMRHKILSEEGKFLGRVHVQVEPAFVVSTGVPVYRVNLVGRGKPIDHASIEGAFAFLDVAHERVRASFAELISDGVQSKWMSEDRTNG